MLRFTALVKETGFDPLTRFLVVGERRSNFVVLHDPDGADLEFDRNKLDVHEVTRERASRAATALQDQFITWGVAGEGSAKAFVGALVNTASFGSQTRLLSVTGKVGGWAAITAVRRGVKVDLSVAVLRQKVLTIAFKFVQHLDKSGIMRPVTRWGPPDVRWLTTKLNWVYGPQANITFDVIEADWVKVNAFLGDPFGTKAFLAYLVQHKNKWADLNVFFVGNRWISDDGDAAGTHFYDHDACVVVDNANLPFAPGADPFIVTLAHEVAHYLRGVQGHHSRPNVLLSDTLQTTAVDKQLVLDINPPW